MDMPGMDVAMQFDEYGVDHLVIPRPLGGEVLITRDATAMNHIMADIYTYTRSVAGTKATKFIIGDGVVAVFGDEHKKQRKMLAPAFSVETLKGFVPLFSQITDQMMFHFQRDTSLESRWGEGVKDCVKWFGRATLDIIGKTGFDYDFGAVEQGPNGLAVRSAFHAAMTSMMNLGPRDALVGAIFYMLTSLFPKLPLTSNIGKLREMRNELINVSQKIVQAKAKQIRNELEAGLDANEMFGGKKDILHLLMRANMSPDVRQEDRLSDGILAGQIVTFIFAGHETTATTMSWCAYFLALRPSFQASLRQHIQKVLQDLGRDGDNIAHLSWNELNSEHFRPLDHAIQETLRLRPPLFAMYRYAHNDDQIPVTTPFRAKDGRLMSSIPVRAGQSVGLSVTGNSMDPKYFGPDTHLFRPERWETLPAYHASAGMPSPYGSFVFSAGPKVCIGSKFAMTEMKIILIRLLARYRVAPVPGLKYKAIDAVVLRPAVVGYEHEGSQLPLRYIHDPL
jgi:cytochrome P450